MISIKFRNKDKSGNWINSSSASESELRNELRSYLSLKENWDGEGAKIPTQESVNDALKFLDNRPDNIPLPYPEEGFDGDAGLYWCNRKAQVFAEVTFDGDNKFSFFAVHGTPKNIIEKYGEDGVDVHKRWPSNLLKILKKLPPTKPNFMPCNC